MTRTADVLEVKRQSVKTHISGRCRGCERHDKKRHVYQWPRALKYLLRDAWCPACGAKLRGSSVELRDPIVYHGTPEFIPIHRAPAPRGRQVKDAGRWRVGGRARRGDDGEHRDRRVPMNLELHESITMHGAYARVSGLPSPCFAKVRWAGKSDVPNTYARSTGYVLSTQSTGGKGSRRHTFYAVYSDAIAHALRWANRKAAEINRAEVKAAAKVMT